MRVTSLVLAIVAVPSLVAAQTVWTVGPSGAQFQQLQPAIDAAAPGDIIEVQVGAYLPAEMTKGLTILAAPGTQIAMPVFSAAVGLYVHGVPAGERVAITNLDFSVGPFATYELRIEDCAGPVHLEDITSTGNTLVSNTNWPALQVRRCPRVTMARVRLDVRGGTVIEDSTVAACDCSFRGSPGYPVTIGLEYSASAGLQVTNASVELSRCDVSGGDGWRHEGGPAVVSTGGSLVIGGVAGTTISGGRSSSGGRAGSLVGTGVAVVDPVVTLNPSPALVPSYRPLPSLVVSAAARGGTIDGELAAEPGQSYAVFLALPAAPVATPFGTVWIAPQPAVVARSGAIGASGAEQWSVAVPALAQLEAVVLTWQAFATTSAGPHSSNPGEQVIR